MKSTSFRTFFVYPLVVLAFEFFIHGEIRVEPLFLVLMVWGYLQYLLVGAYRLRHGGGGPGMGTPPERLVTSGPYAWCRNPMYLGHMIFLLGLALGLRSWLGVVIFVVNVPWFHFRALRDENRLRALFGVRYEEYHAKVKRWAPRLF